MHGAWVCNLARGKGPPWQSQYHGLSMLARVKQDVLNDFIHWVTSTDTLEEGG